MPDAQETSDELSDELFLCPLYTPAFEMLGICWALEDCEIESNHLVSRSICCMQPQYPDPAADEILSTNTLRPFLFMIVGQISRHDCHLTTDGRRDRTVGHLASCWIKPCARDEMSRLEWDATACSIHHIMDTIHAHSRADVLVARGQPLRIQLFYEPGYGQVCISFSNMHMLP